MIQILWEDERCQTLLTQFARDYSKAQRSLEVSELAGSAAFEILLTLVLAAVTAGTGAIVNLASKARLARQMTDLGESLKELADLKKVVNQHGEKRALRTQATGDITKDLPVDNRPPPQNNPPPKGDYMPREGVTPLDGDRVYKRDHLGGDTKDPYTLQEDGKPLGAKEGVMPADALGLDEFDPELQKLIDEQGYPDVAGREDFMNFSDIKPVELKEGETIYRIVDEGSAEARGGSGTYWAREIPQNKSAWRDGYAVKDSWNDNGYYVEHTVGPEGMKVWEGTTAGQKYETFEGKKFYLEGGQQQLYVEYNSIPNLSPKVTTWSDAAQ
ncbi:hypothetical protein [Endozoicomonas numazuensis]|uniref:hypothetical protein n=1 Tax=Endozoicomonas numazuensis TaxID=1137799 RepID=UPI00069253C8|nr:hypothetical protein [Endozoicomonas numazuensis]